MDSEKYLQEGPLTQITPYIKAIAEKINEEGIYVVFEIFEYLKGNLPFNRHIQSNQHDKFLEWHQRRTAEEILKSGFSISCADDGVVFCTLARAKGIPTKFIQCVDLRSYLRPSQKKGPNGHVLCQLLVKDKLYIVDPQAKRLTQYNDSSDKGRMYSTRGVDYKTAIEGLDNQDAGVSNHQELLDALAKAAKEFLQQYISS